MNFIHSLHNLCSTYHSGSFEKKAKFYLALTLNAGYMAREARSGVKMAVLSVGSGKPYSTITAAVAAAQNGDTIEVQAGTYTNQYVSINKNITLQGVGGMVSMVSTGLIPNGKAIFITSGNITINTLNFPVQRSTTATVLEFAMRAVISILTIVISMTTRMACSADHIRPAISRSIIASSPITAVATAKRIIYILEQWLI
jgi:hypothetical protein